MVDNQVALTYFRRDSGELATRSSAASAVPFFACCRLRDVVLGRTPISFHIFLSGTMAFFHLFSVSSNSRLTAFNVDSFRPFSVPLCFAADFMCCYSGC